MDYVSLIFVFISCCFCWIIGSLQEEAARKNKQIDALCKNITRLENSSNKLQGLLTKLTIEAKVSKEIAKRAFNMASSSQVCVATLQTAIAKKPRGYQAEVKESVASKKIGEELGGEDINDFLYAVMTEEERHKIDKTRKYFNAGI